MDKTSIGDRIKGYEHTSRSFLQRRTPVIIRVDGKAFHTWTKGLKDIDASLAHKPYSDVMHNTMTATAHSMMLLIQNAVLAYTQSDEISILLNDWKSLNTDQWYGANVQKITSVSASIAATCFNFFYQNNSYDSLPVSIHELAQFDARVFNLPKEEVVNYFIWRQQDATRNSINMLGQFHFSHKELHGKSVGQVQDMLMLDKGVNWNNQKVWEKRGTCVIPSATSLSSAAPFADEDIPIFTRDRTYIERHLQAEPSSTVTKKGGPPDAEAAIKKR